MSDVCSSPTHQTPPAGQEWVAILNYPSLGFIIKLFWGREQHGLDSPGRLVSGGWLISGSHTQLNIAPFGILKPVVQVWESLNGIISNLS